MGYTFNTYGDRKLWRSNFTVEHPDGTTSKEQVQVDVTNDPDHWQKANKKLPKAIKGKLDIKQLQKEAKIQADSPVTDDKKTVRETCIDFLNENATPVPIKGGEKRPTLKPNTISEYDHYFNNYIIPELGTVRIARLTSLQVYNFYRKVQANGASGSTLEHLRRRFQAFLTWAVEKHYIDNNPTGKDSIKLVSRAAKLQRENKPREKNLTVAQLMGIRELIETKYKRFELTTTFLAYHGLRIGEALAVRFEDIDLDANRVTISHQVQNVTAPKLIDVEYETGLKDVTPKTLEGNRVIRLDDRTKTLIEAIPFEDRQGYVLKTNTGKAVNQRNFSRDYIYKLKADLVEQGLMDASEKFTAHMFRKFYATALTMNGVDDMAIKSNMGHKDISTTQKHYLVDIEDRNQINFNVSDWIKEVQTT